tara:strand:- start:1145 stop:1438 length:294 start_codon:yes stop_codon:yes gene_type:complete
MQQPADLIKMVPREKIINNKTSGSPSEAIHKDVIVGHKSRKIPIGRFILVNSINRGNFCCISDAKFVNFVETNLSKNFIFSSVSEVLILYYDLNKKS